MNKFYILLSAVLLTADFVYGSVIPVKTVRYAGPFVVQRPLLIDSVDVKGLTFNAKSLLDTPLSLEQVRQGREVSGAVLPTSDAPYALHLLGFRIQADGYGQAMVRVGKLSDFNLYVDGQQSRDGKLTLEPGSHDVVVKYLSKRGRSDSLDIQVEPQKGALLSVGEGEKTFTLRSLTDRRFMTGVELSPDGKYLITAFRDVAHGGKTSYCWQVKELKTGHIVATRNEAVHWMPHFHELYWTRQGKNSRELVTSDVETGVEKVIATNLPEGSFVLSPTADYLVVMQKNEGKKKDRDVYEITEPEDRQPGWRNRTSLLKFDLRTGLAQPLTFGYHDVSLLDINNDGSKVLFMTTRTRLTHRPTTLFSIFCLDVRTLKADTLVCDDGFIASAAFSPNGKEIVVMGSPEAFNGIGANVPNGRVPSMYDYQLFTLRLSDRQVTPLTKTFDPGISQYAWNHADGKLYFSAMNRDSVSLYCCDTKSKKIVKIHQPEEVVKRMSFAHSAPIMAWAGESASNADRVYTMNLSAKRPKVVEDTNLQTLAGIRLGECKAWNFVNSRGDTICTRYYLPPHFDPSKHYPLIVNYYGGCSPTSRNFETRYPHHAYAALGYVVLVIQPSGAVGFGQEFSSRHVNTAGQGVAEDIIEGTKKFVADHTFINGKKIGCIGASYGGFMTQYLQTQTNLFAAAISHAGISDHTSYWGEGYWGYSYSEVSMANRYPWTDKKLYVNQSPLFNADKIHTPLLFLHGSADTNVPIGESIQMFTALKLLGRPTAFVVVDGENHHITDYNKRLKWQNTIFAWFAKWLKDDSTWWDSLYGEPKL